MPAMELHKYVHHEYIIICKVRTNIFLNTYTFQKSEAFFKKKSYMIILTSFKFWGSVKNSYLFLA